MWALTPSSTPSSVSWNYDANGSLTGLTYPTGGPNPTYLPNALGEPTQVGNYATNIGFHPNGAISGFAFGNNIAHSLTQTVEGTPKLNADGTVLKDLYTYDANGNVATIVDQRSTAPDGWFNRTMSYDDLDRLSSVTAPGVWNSATYLYDAVDDLRSVTVGSRSSTLTYGAVTKRLDSVVTNGVTTAYGYDGNGNISAKGSQTYAFDLGNRMASASLGGSYSYDGHGRRTKIVSSDGTQIQLYSQAGQLLWSEKTAVGTGTFPATATYSCSTGTLSGTQCQITSTYAASSTMSCNQGGTLSGNACNLTTSTPAAATYSCPSGGSLNGATCTTAATTSYSCPAGGVRNGTVCTTSSTYAATATYTCPSGGTLVGTGCELTESYSPSAPYSCPNGGTLSGSSCITVTYVPATVTYTCQSGYTLAGSVCSQTTTVAASSVYTCNGLGTLTPDGFCTGGGTLAYSPEEARDTCMAQADVYGVTLYSVDHVSGRRYDCTFQADVVYSCSNAGATITDGQCVTTVREMAAVSYHCTTGEPAGGQCPVVTGNYTATASPPCPNGGTLSGNTCVKSTTVAATVASYSCASGDSRTGAVCTNTSTYAASASSSCPSGSTQVAGGCSYAATPAYSCSSGSTLNGSNCTLTTTYAAVAANSCPNGGTLAGTTCTVTTNSAATPAYSCPSGTAPVSGQCSGSNTTKTAYIYLGGKQVAETIVGDTTQYVHTDALGSPVAHTNQAAAELNRTRFEPYGFTAGGTKPGVTTTGLSTTGSAIGFTGHLNDPQTDLVYMQQRYYDPIAGRFLSVDPVVTDAKSGSSFNRYVYGNNNPYKFVDPDGKFAVWVHWSITYSAARDAGYGIGASIGHANRAWMADWEPGSQGKDAAAAARHAMRAIESTKAEAADLNRSLVATAVIRGDLGLAAHAIQDRFASGHSDFTLWEGFGELGFVGMLSHLWADMFPSSDARSGAYQATKSMFAGARNSGGQAAAQDGFSRAGSMGGSSRTCGNLMISGCNSPSDPLPKRSF